MPHTHIVSRVTATAFHYRLADSILALEEPGKVRRKEKAGLGRGERCRGRNAGPQGQVAPRDGGAGGGPGPRTGRGQGRAQGPPVLGNAGTPREPEGWGRGQDRQLPQGPPQAGRTWGGAQSRTGEGGTPGARACRQLGEGRSPRRFLAAGSGARLGSGSGGGPGQKPRGKTEGADIFF